MKHYAVAEMDVTDPSYREARGAGARNEFLLVAGEDSRGVAQISG